MQELHRTGGNRDSIPGGPDLPAGLGGSPGEGGVGCGSL